MEIAKAVANAPKELSSAFSRETPLWLGARKESPAPVVIVKKRRVAVMVAALGGVLLLGETTRRQMLLSTCAIMGGIALEIWDKASKT